MKILHVCLAAPFVDGQTYQENLLVRWHSNHGHDVAVVASTETLSEDKINLTLTSSGVYSLPNGGRLIRLRYSPWIPFTWLKRKLRIYESIEAILTEFRPNVIFVHDVQFFNTIEIRNYCRLNPSVNLIVDCHADFTNSARTLLSRFLLHGIYYKWCARNISQFAQIFWGVLPSRCSFLNEVYDIPIEKISLLEMGIDDALALNVLEKRKDKIKSRKIDGYSKPLTLITGGKIDKFKLETLSLMGEVSKRSDFNLRIFGSVDRDIKNEFFNLVNKSANIDFYGWLSPEEIVAAIVDADIAVYPGRHSVLWEQSVALGVPIAVASSSSHQHLDLGGNLMVWDFNSKQDCNAFLDYLARHFDFFAATEAAIQGGREKFYYSNIARKSLETV